MIHDHRTKREWKIQLKLAINFMSSKDTSEMRTMHSKSDDIEINEADEIIDNIFDSI